MTKLFICGDIINRFSNEQFIDGRLIEIIKAADYAICNYEGVHEFDGSREINMLQRRCTLKLLKNAGFNMTLLANNHITDHGNEGLRQTIGAIDSLGLDRVGADFGYEQAYRPLIKVINGKKFGFINLCEAQEGQYKYKEQEYGYAWIGDKESDNRIKKLRSDVDYLLIFPHAGLELYPLPLQEYRELYKHYIDLGADAVLASHPHIPQGIEIYKERLISYSLGNFYFPKRNISSDDPRNSTYSLLLTFFDKRINFEPIFTELVYDKVYLSEKPNFDLEGMSDIISSPNYESLVKEQNFSAFSNLVYGLYKEALLGISPEDKFHLKFIFILKYVFFCRIVFQKSKPYRFKLLRRLLENETYRWLTINALDDYLNSL